MFGKFSKFYVLFQIQPQFNGMASYGKLSLQVTSPTNWQWPIYGFDGVDRLERITESFMQSCRGLQVGPWGFHKHGLPMVTQIHWDVFQAFCETWAEHLRIFLWQVHLLEFAFQPKDII